MMTSTAFILWASLAHWKFPRPVLYWLPYFSLVSLHLNDWHPVSCTHGSNLIKKIEIKEYIFPQKELSSSPTTSQNSQDWTSHHLLRSPFLIQHFKQSSTMSSTYLSFTPESWSTSNQTCLAQEHLINIWFVVSSSSLHRRQILDPCLALLWTTSQVKTLFIIANHIKIGIFDWSLYLLYYLPPPSWVIRKRRDVCWITNFASCNIAWWYYCDIRNIGFVWALSFTGSKLKRVSLENNSLYWKGDWWINRNDKV